LKALAVIPARYDSSRFAGKVLAKSTGRYLVEHTYLQVRRASGLEEVIIAADDERVAAACREFGGRCIMTSREHASGTDRIAEAVHDIDADVVVNVQADEPEIDPNAIAQLVGLMSSSPDAYMATLVSDFAEDSQIGNPNIVKVVTDNRGRALYFSRSAIPFDRDSNGVGQIDCYYRHIGIYAYRKGFLMKFTGLPEGKLEKIERLEQLRALENGYNILTARVSHYSDGIDTPEQYDEFVKRYLARRGV
jgi:3-deoxy-manno-octulosonate cytidylyltransferase (CMP-KDO synthetase)